MSTLNKNKARKWNGKEIKGKKNKRRIKISEKKTRKENKNKKKINGS